MPEIILMGWDATNKVPVRCKVTADGKLIINPAGFLENPPTEDETKKAPTSEWAFDHKANASAHHAKYTDIEARAAINDIFGADGKADKTIHFDSNIFTEVAQIGFVSPGYPLASGTMVYRTATSKFRIICKDEDGAYQDFKLTKYNGSADKYFISEDIFQVELAKFLEASPTNGVTDKAPNSNWAFDHNADASAHHAKYTDKGAVDAWYNRFLQINTGTIENTDVTNVSYILFNTSGGNIILRGLSGGSTGKMIFCVKNYDGNNLDVIHAYADGGAGYKIYTPDGTTQSIANNQRGAFWIVHHGGNWILDRLLP